MQYLLSISYVPAMLLALGKDKGNFPVLREGESLLVMITAHLQMGKKKHQDLKVDPLVSSGRDTISKQVFWLLL